MRFGTWRGWVIRFGRSTKPYREGFLSSRENGAKLCSYPRYLVHEIIDDSLRAHGEWTIYTSNRSGSLYGPVSVGPGLSTLLALIQRWEVNLFPSHLPRPNNPYKCKPSNKRYQHKGTPSKLKNENPRMHSRGSYTCAKTSGSLFYSCPKNRGDEIRNTYQPRRKIWIIRS